MITSFASFLILKHDERTLHPIGGKLWVSFIMRKCHQRCVILPAATLVMVVGRGGGARKHSCLSTPWKKILLSQTWAIPRKKCMLLYKVVKNDDLENLALALKKIKASVYIYTTGQILNSFNMRIWYWKLHWKNKIMLKMRE